jgi:hypothetical protein
MEEKAETPLTLAVQQHASAFPVQAEGEEVEEPST